MTAAVLVGCGTRTGDATPAAASLDPTGTVEPTRAPTSAAPAPAPTTTRDVPPPAPDDTPSLARPTTTKGRLLPPDSMPAPSAQVVWKTGTTRASEGRVPVGTCHRFAMTSIGAMKVVTRTYAPTKPSNSSAAHLVAEFPDARTAKRAYAVLTAWHDQCAELLAAHDAAEVGSLQQVEAGSATAAWYQLSYGSTVDAQGIARSGARIAVLTIRTDGLDEDQPAKAPMVTAVRRAAALL